jgi:hypothetical protein
MQKISPSSKHHPLYAKRRVIRLPFKTEYFLAALEGIEGGFAIGSSIVIALGIAGLERHLLLATAIVSIIVNGFNSASVKYSSEHYLDELDGHEKKNAFRVYFVPSFIEFVCYLILSFFSVMPLILVKDLSLAIISSVILTIILLFVAGYVRAYMVQAGRVRDGLETAFLGIGIMLVGLVSGLILHSL